MKMALVCLAVLLLMLGTCVFTIVFTARKFKGNAIAYFAGFLSMFVMQFVLRIPALQLLGQTPAYVSFAAAHPVALNLILAFTASLFEGSGRILFGYWLLKRALIPQNGVRLGAGHAITETFLIGVVSYIANTALAFIATNPEAAQALSAQTPQLKAAFDLFNSSPAAGPFFIAAYERFVVVFAQIGLGIMALYALAHKCVWTALLMLALHMLLDSFGAFALMLGINVSQNLLLIEGYVTVISAAVFFAGVKYYKRWQAAE